jgi:hypothetical protein
MDFGASDVEISESVFLILDLRIEELDIYIYAELAGQI